ncbi:MAG: redoxin family protein [Candidatus Hydrogenedentes bacterium]|nr:redoxin family protein [Candidatus Hydrogenedentota bacterium]
MRKMSIVLHFVVILLSAPALAGLWYLFGRYGDGFFLQGTLRARAYSLFFPGAFLSIGTVVGGCLLLSSLGRLLQLLFPGTPLIGRWQGLRPAANACILLILLALLAGLPFVDIVADPIRTGLQRVIPGLGPVVLNASRPMGPPPDSSLDFPRLPMIPEENSLAGVKFTGLEGNAVTLGEWGGKAVFLNIWATWCGPCRAEMPNIEALYTSLKDERDIVFILAADDQEEVLKTFLKDNPLEAPVYLMDDESKKRLKITGFPTTMILSKEGEVVFRELGSAAWDGGTTKAFLLALARDLPFDPRSTSPIEVFQAAGLVFGETVISSENGVMGLAYGADDTVYYADFFNGTVGRLDLQSGALEPVLTGLNHPKKVFPAGEHLYFLESGTEAAEFKDGALSRYNLASGERETLCGGLEYPDSLFIDSVGDLYVVEAAGYSTTFGGHSRLIVFRQGSSAYDVVLDNLFAPKAVLVDGQGDIYLGTLSDISPGDTAKLLKYAKGATSPVEIAKWLPSVNDMAFDGEGNLYLAGFGGGTEPAGICLLAKGGVKVKTVKTGHRVNCIALNPDGDILYSTGGGPNSIRLLRRVK